MALVYCLFPFSFCGCICFSRHVIVITNFKALLKCRAKFRFVTPGTLKLLSNSQTYGHTTGHAIRISLWRLRTDVNRTRKTTRPARTDKMTRRTHKRSRLVKTMSWTGNSTSRTRKTTFDLGGNRTHDLRIRSTVTLPTELRGRTEKVGDDWGGESRRSESKGTYEWCAA